MSDFLPRLPGLLGDPNLTLATDPRIDPRLIEVLVASWGYSEDLEEFSLANHSYEELLESLAAHEAMAAPMYAKIFSCLPPVLGVTRRTEVITGVDGNEMTLYIHEPAETSRPLPGIVHIHGGGMGINSANEPQYIRWKDELATRGLVVVGVEFRNSAGKLGNHAFPAGLNDCASATQWTYANKDTLGISHVVLSGESGGGNLSIATALKAKREGWIEQIAGVYACCPYLAGPEAYNSPPPELMSLRENAHLAGPGLIGGFAKVYDPSGENTHNPLAWPLQAAAADLAGLPPHTVSVNELDPIRDEALVYARKLMAAGVPTLSRTVNGTIHGGDTEVMVGVMPDVYGATLRDIQGFATSLTPS
tara:strand:+ start:10751 stop:11839 length:1089 start_codon:yes stop_codon:yes gene_type:complete